jgi:hypothetical protein
MNTKAPQAIHQSSSPMRVELIDSLAALSRVGPAYDDLLRTLDGTCFPIYQRYWLENTAPIYINKGDSLFFLLVWDNDQLIAVAPLRCKKIFLGIGTIQRLSFIGQYADTVSMVNYTGDFIVRDEADPASCMEAIKVALTGPYKNRWDYLNLGYFCETSSNLCAFERVFNATGVVEEMPGFHLDLPESWDSLSRQFNTKTNRNLRRSMRLLVESGHSFSFETHTNLTPSLLEEISSVHSARQAVLTNKGRSDRDALFQHVELKDAVGRALREAAERQQLRLHFLRIDDRLAAFAIVLTNNQKGVCWLIAFDPVFQEFSPSRLVFQRMYTEEMETYGLRKLNLLLGFTRTKKELSTSCYEARRYEVSNESSTRSALKRRLFAALKSLISALKIGQNKSSTESKR